MADISIIADYSSVKAANKELLKVGSTAQKSAAVYTQAFKAVDAENKRQLKSVRDQISFSQKMERQKAREAKVSAAAAQLVAKEEERLKNKFVQGYTAMDRYSKELNDLAMARKKDLISTKEQRLAVAALNKDLAAGTGIFATYGNSLTQGRNKMSSMGVVTQQAGYQLGDFIVQVQGGQSAFIAFSQQATQMVGFLPLMAASLGLTAGAAIGLSAALGIAIPLISSLAMVLLTVSKSSKKAEESQKDLKDSLEDVLKTLREANDEWDEFESGLLKGEASFSSNLYSAAQDLRKAKEDLENLTFTEGFLGGMFGALPFGTFGVEADLEEIRAAQEALNDAQQKYNKFLDEAGVRSSQLAIDTTATINNRIALLRVEQKFGEGSLEYRRAAFEQELESFALAQRKAGVVEESIQPMLDLLQAEEDLKLEIIATAEATQEFLDKLFSIDFSDAISGANKLANEMSRAAGNAWDFMVANTKRIEAGRKLPLDDLAAQYAQYGAGRKAFQEEASSKRYSADSTYDGFETSIPKANKTAPKGSTSETGLEAAQKLLREAEAKNKIVGLTQEQAHYEELLFKMQEDNAKKRDPLTQAELKGYADKIHAIQEQTRVSEEAAKQQQALADSIASSMGNALTGIVDGTMTVKDAFRSMARDIIKQLYQVIVVQRIVGNAEKGTGLAGMIMGAFQANGGAWSNGSQVKAYANGGVVGGPTTFPMAGGKTGLMGEAGPEAIMPLKRGANGKLGVQMEGGGGDTIVVNQSFNFQANGDATIKQLIAQAAPKIAQMTKSSLLDDRRRGGSTKAAFG